MKKITLIELEDRIKQRYPFENFKIIKFQGLGKEGQIQCLECGTVITVSKMSNFFVKTKRYGCLKCHGLYKQREQKLQCIKEKYIIIDSFVKETHTYYKVQCKDCNHIRITTLKNLYGHLECGCKTNVKRNRTAEEFIDEVNRFSNNGKYTLISPYINQTTIVSLKHECGFIWEVRPGDVIHGHCSCPKCGRYESKSVRFIASLLRQNNIPFEQEKLLNNSRLRFDFYLEKNEFKIAIEYNGQQHYQETSYFKTSLQQQQKRDKRKQEYCKNNNIQLIIIPYTKNNEQIREIIFQIINKFNDYPEEEYITSDW